MIQELEYLADLSLITPQQLSSILSQLPSQHNLQVPTPQPTPSLAPQTTNYANLLLDEKKQPGFAAEPSPAAPPPAYGATPALPARAIASATALYDYNPTDAGDLALAENDRIAITEFMNVDWAKGRNERTGQEGIFPRSYVKIMEEKASFAAPLPPRTPSNYGNVPSDVSQGGGGASSMMGGGAGSKVNDNTKKFGKRLGNAGEFLHR